MRVRLLSILMGIVIAAAASGPAGAQTVLGTHGDWTAFTDGSGNSKICYMASQPRREEGDYTSRGDTFVLVTHRPAENARDTVEVRAGYTYKEDSEVRMVIDGTTYELFTSEGSAWARDQQTDTALAKAMIKGNRMVVHGTSSRGTATKDTYSLSGFTAAYQAISKACGVN